MKLFTSKILYVIRCAIHYCHLTYCSCKPKVAELDHAPLGDENILGFHIAMNDLKINHMIVKFFLSKQPQFKFNLLFLHTFQIIVYVWLTFLAWQNSTPLSTWNMILLTKPSSAPEGYRSRSSRAVWSTNSNTRYSRFLRRNTSIRFTRFSCRT